MSTRPRPLDRGTLDRRTLGPWGLLTALVVLASGLAMATVVDLSPQVESDFFFSTDDPQLLASARIGELFPSEEQLIVSATAPDILADDYLERLRHLAADLKAIDGITRVQSLVEGPSSPTAVAESPLWSRLLLGENAHLSQVLAWVEDGTDGRRLVDDVHAVLAEHHRASFVLDVSGVPYVVELIRRSLERDLRLFSLASLLVFGLLVALVYRRPSLVLGTLITCLGACATSLTILSLLGAPIGLLTANIITIVFVLTLSHLVFLTANWHRELAAGPDDERDPTHRAVRRTLEASAWCMGTTLLGFASLLFADAKPLRELGLAGAVGTAVAIAIAYGLYPVFLRLAAPKRQGGDEVDDGEETGGTEETDNGVGWLRGQRLLALGGPVTVALVMATAIASLGLGRLDTDPNLLSYFAEGSVLRTGLERIDRNGGSSPLLVVMKDPGGAKLDSDEAIERLAALQEAIDRDPAVGSSLSLPILLQEARRAPMAFLLDWRALITILDSPSFGRIARSFLTEDRTRALLFLRMGESERDEPRRQVIQRIEETVRAHGVEPELVGGLYELQASLGALVASSVFRGLGGLLLLFAIIAVIVARRGRRAAAMILALAAVPVLLLGAIGFGGQPLDLISSPAANVAIALGIDSMIHLVTAVRRRRQAGEDRRAAWTAALDHLAPAIAGAAGILAAGFGIFALSSFPPTQRFGLAVAFGTLAAAVVALFALPTLAHLLERDGLERDG